MSSSVIREIRPRNGDIHSAVALPLGMDVLDAAYHCAHSFPGGVPALAVRMGMSPNTLMHKVSLNNTTHHLSLRMAKEFGEVLAAVNDAVADGRVSHNEMLACERQAAELQAALNGVLSVVRGLMPAQKGGEA